MWETHFYSHIFEVDNLWIKFAKSFLDDFWVSHINLFGPSLPLVYGMHNEQILKNLDNGSKASYEDQVRLFTLGVKT